jgi:hypothetical protein
VDALIWIKQCEIIVLAHYFRFWPILLKKSEYRLGPIFSAPCVRFSDADAGGPHHPPQTQRSEFQIDLRRQLTSIEDVVGILADLQRL